MKEEIVTSDHYSHFLWCFRVPWINQNVQLSFQVFPVHEKALGMTNRTSSGQYFVMLDYDDMQAQEISDEAEVLQKNFRLGDFYFFALDREDSYHAICPTLLSAHEVLTIIRASSADEAFKNAPRFFGRSRWILRIGQKGQRKAPEYNGKSPSFEGRPESEGLKIFLEAYYNVPVKYRKNDIHDTVQFIEYETSNRVKK